MLIPEHTVKNKDMDNSSILVQLMDVWRFYCKARRSRPQCKADWVNTRGNAQQREATSISTIRTL